MNLAKTNYIPILGYFVEYIRGDKMKKSKRATIIVVVFITFLVHFIINAFVIYRYGKIDEKRKSDVVIILGAATDINGVSPVYRERINHGIWLYENNYADYIIVTGGKADGAEFSDAYYAKRYVLSKEVPEDVVFIEEQSKITQENIKNAKEIMEENKWETSIIVSDPLHMKRSMLIANDYDINAVSSPTQSSKYQSWKTKVPFLLREEFFYVGYKIWKIFCS